MKCNKNDSKFIQFQYLKELPGILNENKFINNIVKLIKNNILKAEYVFEYFGCIGNGLSISLMSEFVTYYKPYVDFDPYLGIINLLYNLGWNSCWDENHISYNEKLYQRCKILFNEIDFNPENNEYILICLIQGEEFLIKEIEIILTKYILSKLSSTIKIEDIINNFKNKEWVYFNFYKIDIWDSTHIFNLIYSIENADIFHLRFLLSNNIDFLALDKIIIEISVKKAFQSLLYEKEEVIIKRFEILKLLLEINCIVYTNNLFSSNTEMSLIKNNIWQSVFLLNSENINETNIFKLNTYIPNVTKIIYLLGDYFIYCVKTKNGKIFNGSDLDYLNYDTLFDDENKTNDNKIIVNKEKKLFSSVDNNENIFIQNDISEIYIENDMYLENIDDYENELSDFSDNEFSDSDFSDGESILFDDYIKINSNIKNSVSDSDIDSEYDLLDSPFIELSISETELEKSQELYNYIQNISVEYRNKKSTLILKQLLIPKHIIYNIVLPYMNLG